MYDSLQKPQPKSITHGDIDSWVIEIADVCQPRETKTHSL